MVYLPSNLYALSNLIGMRYITRAPRVGTCFRNVLLLRHVVTAQGKDLGV